MLIDDAFLYCRLLPTIIISRRYGANVFAGCCFD